MFKFLNNKLYNQYYPLKTETDKYQFLRNNIDELRLIINKVCANIQGELFHSNYSYINKMKPIVSSSGKIKTKNIIHNDFIYSKMELDFHTLNLEEKLEALSVLKNKLEEKEYDEIDIETLNFILSFHNSEKRRALVPLLLCCIGILCARAYMFFT